MKENNFPSKNTTIKTIHTYSSDMAEAVRDNDVSVIKIALAEQKKREREIQYKKSEVSPLAKLFLFVGGLVILSLAGGAIYFVSHTKKQNSTIPVVTSQNNSTLIPFTKELVIDTKSRTSFADVAQEIHEKIKTTLDHEGIVSISLVRSTPNKPERIPLENFLSFIPVTAPESLVRSLDSNYMIGSYQSSDTKKHPNPFIIFKIKDYNQTYAGTLMWEKRMSGDFVQLFSTDTASYITSTQDRPWRDIIIQNNNARVLYDDAHTPLLYYIFVNKDYFILSDDKDTLSKLFQQLLLKNKS